MEKASQNIKESEINSKEFPKVSCVKNFNKLQNISLVGDSELVEMGDYLLLEKNENITACTYGANPCISGIIQTKDNQLYMFHSIGGELTQSQLEIIQKSKKGIIGGGSEALKDYKFEFDKSNIEIINQPDERYDFNIVFVKDKNKSNVSPGIYYCYEKGF
jgi:hypothetical protein